MTEHKLGWIKDPYDPRDRLYMTRTPTALPPIIDLSQYLPRDKNGKVIIRDQGNVGSCVGHGLSVNVCSVAVSLGIWSQQLYEYFSPTWIYNGARYIEGTLYQDAGAEPGDGLDWMVKSGTLLDHFWPYDPSKVDTNAPSTLRKSEAVKYPDFAYQRMVDGVDGILTGLAEGHFVSIGAPWYSAWEGGSVDSTGILPEVKAGDPIDGGHETCLFYADQPNRIFLGIQSWGKWGGAFGVAGASYGFYKMPFSAIDAFKADGGYDGHVITFNPLQPVPPVPPTPPKPKCCLKACWSRWTDKAPQCPCKQQQ